VRAKALTTGEAAVFEEEPESEGFVFRLHRDGVRRLCLLPPRPSSGWWSTVTLTCRGSCCGASPWASSRAAPSRRSGIAMVSKPVERLNVSHLFML
jgi:hypothetical protein